MTAVPEGAQRPRIRSHNGARRTRRELRSTASTRARKNRSPPCDRRAAAGIGSLRGCAPQRGSRGRRPSISGSLNASTAAVGDVNPRLWKSRPVPFDERNDPVARKADDSLMTTHLCDARRRERTKDRVELFDRLVGHSRDASRHHSLSHIGVKISMAIVSRACDRPSAPVPPSMCRR